MSFYTSSSGSLHCGCWWWCRTTAGCVHQHEH